MKIIWKYSNAKESWADKIASKCPQDQIADITWNGQEYQRMHGFGGCFNEAGYNDLSNM